MSHHNKHKDIAWPFVEIKTPPFSESARIESGSLLRQLQGGEFLSMPTSRPMPTIGNHCHELRIHDSEKNKEWRIIYRIDDDAVVILDVFAKTTQKTPNKVIDNCQRRLKLYDELS
jgi:phage-related protein